VLVVGGGNSSCDIVAEAARVGKSAHLSLRRDYWFMPKTLFGMPTAEVMTTWMPVWLQRIYLGSLLKIVVGDYRKYGLMKPNHKIFEHHPSINAELLHYLKHGKIIAHPDIKRFDGSVVRFVDGVKEEFDMIVCGTGFNVSVPFLAPDLVEINGPIVKTQWGVVAPAHRQLYLYSWAQALWPRSAPHTCIRFNRQFDFAAAKIDPSAWSSNSAIASTNAGNSLAGSYTRAAQDALCQSHFVVIAFDR
jgi:hypothetical protein